MSVSGNISKISTDSRESVGYRKAAVSNLKTLSAREDFRHARRKAAIQQVIDRLRRQPDQLLPFDEISQSLKAEASKNKELQEIPLEAIVGSVSRYEDYTRNFLPKYDSDEERWVRVKEHIDRAGLNPISVYKLGEVYFVSDGNHRVSIARQMGSKTILANVTEVKSRVHLNKSDKPEQIICKARYAEFLEKTNIDKLRPEQDLLMTLPGQYRFLLEQIDAQHYLMQLQPGSEQVTYEDAVAAWYDRVYVPLVKLINKQGLERSFPGLTEADMYIMVLRHRTRMQQDLEWFVDLTAVASDLASKRSTTREQVVERMSDRIIDAVTPDAFETGPAPGTWREDRLAKRPSRNPFADILVAIQGQPNDLEIMEHSAIIAKRENGRLLALQVKEEDMDSNHGDIKRAQQIFHTLCASFGVRGEFAVESGSFSREIVRRLAWTDLLAIGYVRHPERKTPTGFGSKFNRILQRSPRPILVVPEGSDSTLDKALLAYDGSEKSDEALYLAAYLVKEWRISLVVVVAGDDLAPTALHRVQTYLSFREIPAEFVSATRPAYKAILTTAKEHGANFIVMGGFGYRPLLQLVLGSTVTKIIHRANMPIFICR